MSPFGLPISCVRCGGTLSLRQSVERAGTESTAILHCPACNREWVMSAFLRPVPQPESVRAARYRKTAVA